MLGNAELGTSCKPIGKEEEKMRQFFLDRVRMDPLLDGQNYIYMHYADMIANGYHRLAPCPFQTQGIMLNPERRPVLLREQRRRRQRARPRSAGEPSTSAKRARRIATRFATRSARRASAPAR